MLWTSGYSYTSMQSTIGVLWGTFEKYRWYIAALALLGFMSALLDSIAINAAIPMLSFLLNGTATDFISRAVESVFNFVHIPFSFRYLMLFIIVLYLVRALSSVLFGYIRGWIVADFINSKTREMLSYMFGASWSYLLRQRLGYVQGTLTRDIQACGNMLEGMAQVIQSVTGLIMYIGVALTISPLMTFVTLCGGATLVFIIRPFMHGMHRHGSSIATTEKEVTHFLGEHVMGMKIVKASAAEDAAFSYSTVLLDRLRLLSVKVALIRALSGSLFQPFALIFIIGLFAVTYHSPSFSFISFAAVLYLIQKIFTYLESGNTALNGVITQIPYARNIERFKTQLALHREEIAQGSSPFSFEKEIEFKGVSLNYGRDVRALNSVSLCIKRGTTVALIGPSGAGKTSMADLLLRLFEPTEGTILLDGAPLSDIGLDEWRRHTGYVAQDVFLLNDTIEQNIRFYRPELTRAQIEEAAKQANLYEFISGLKDGFDTMVGDRGVLLSGGQRQRVALARALARAPELLILDEATSALDTESERLIQEAIQNVHGKITIVIIAHRLSTVENADKIVVLVEGGVVEEGSPEALHQNPASYLSRMQEL